MIRLEIYSLSSGNILGHYTIETPEDVESLPETDIQSSFVIQTQKGKISGKFFLVILNNKIKHTGSFKSDEIAITTTTSTLNQNPELGSSTQQSAKHKLDQILDIKQTPVKASTKSERSTTQARTGKQVYNQSYSRSTSKNSQKKNSRALSTVK